VRRSVLPWALFGATALCLSGCQGASPFAQHKDLPAPTIVKQPVNFAVRIFDPANPPADMPPMPAGEAAQCESNFTSNATVGGQSRRADATHGTLTVTQIKVTLQLSVTIWAPAGVTDRVMEHERGHRQISESYYQAADKLAAQIASKYMGKRVEVSGDDLNVEFSKALQRIGAEITDEYGKELDSDPAQLLYDSITDHSRNDVAVQEAVDHALKNAAVESAPAASAGNTDPK
jgi:hypothetical protein